MNKTLGGDECNDDCEVGRVVIRQLMTEGTDLQQQGREKLSHDMKNAVIVAGSVWRTIIQRYDWS